MDVKERQSAMQTLPNQGAGSATQLLHPGRMYPALSATTFSIHMSQ